MTTYTSKDGRTATMTKRGARRGMAKLICVDATGAKTEHEFQVPMVRKHMAGLYEQGWR